MSNRTMNIAIYLIGAFMLISTVVNADPNGVKEQRLTEPDKAAAFMILQQIPGYGGGRNLSNGKHVINLRSSNTNSPGNIIANTYAEYQQTGGIGRKISLGYPQNEYTHMIWLSHDALGDGANIGIYYQVYEMGSYVYDAGGISASNQPNTVESSLGILADNRVVVGSGPYFYSSDAIAGIEYDLIPGVFMDHFLHPDTLAEWYIDGMLTLFPATEIHFGTDTVIYILTSGRTSSRGYRDFVLYRKVGDGGFDNGQMIESRFNYAYTIVARQSTDSVALIYFAEVEGGSGDNYDRNIVYRLSTDQGLTWGPQTNISNYTPDSLFRAYVDVSALWDDNGDLHVVWNARYKDPTQGYDFYSCQLLHWSMANEQTSTITEARYPSECHSDLWDMNAAKPSISFCEGKLHVIWTQYNDHDVMDDCSEAGFANGELYLSVSGNYGLTWDTAVNLTNTRTPGCASGDCESDVYPSMTRYGAEYAGARDSLDIIYINDKDAGVADWSMGDWTLNNVMHYRIPCRDVVNTSYCKPGDANNDRQVNVGDAVYLISYIFKGGSPPIPFVVCNGDANGDCQCNVGDAVFIISYVFKAGPAPIEYYGWYLACGTP